MKIVSHTLLFLCLFTLKNLALAHGLMESPPSRNWFCGVITKPHEVLNDVAEFPECGQAFGENDLTTGYQFMSVLTHDLGRAVVSPLPQQV